LEQDGTPALFRAAKLARPDARDEAFLRLGAGFCRNQPGELPTGGPLSSWALSVVEAPAERAQTSAIRVSIMEFSPAGRRLVVVLKAM
jgi:hypothetical protein